MLWGLFHPMPTIGSRIRLLEYARTAGIPTTRMAGCVTFYSYCLVLTQLSALSGHRFLTEVDRRRA